MTPPNAPLREACRTALAALEADPLNPPPEVLAHLQQCPACAEARVLWLAQEDAPVALAPAAYYQKLPGRILRKLPVRTRRSRLLPWAAAAALVGAAALGGFWAGRLNRTPVLEAKTAPAPAEPADVPTDTPFTESDDVLLQLQQLSPEESRALVERMRHPSRPDPE